jgi:hypothetical protein
MNELRGQRILNSHHKSASRWTAVAATGLLAITLSGCGFIQQQTPGVFTPKRGAKLLAAPDVAQNPSQEVVNYYGNSFSECMNFKEALLSATTGINAGSDYASLILSALGSVIAPIGTVHLLTAGAMAAAGLKSTFTNDVTTDNAVNLTIAFDKIYFQPMAKLAETTLSSAITNDNAPGIVAQIVSLQEQCSLDEARAYINQNLSQGAALKPTGEPLSSQPAIAARRPNSK